MNAIGYFNDFSNPLTDWTSLQADILKFSRMQDPYTGKRLLIVPNTILVNPAKVATANLIVSATGTERRTAPGATQAGYAPGTNSNRYGRAIRVDCLALTPHRPIH